MSKKFNKFGSSIFYAIIGDIIGYGNSEIEFNFGCSNRVNSQLDVERISGWSVKHVVDFISKGGISNLKSLNYKVSDDSILLMAVLDALVKTYNQDDDIIVKQIQKSMIHYYNNDKHKDKRNYGIRTVKSFNKIMNNQKILYNKMAGGSGASMRSMPIGLLYSGKNNRKKLIYISIMSSIITHNNPIAYLGGLASALFTAFAIEGVQPNKWPFKLLDIIKSPYVKNLIHKINNITPQATELQNKDVDQFVIWWDTYINLRFKNKKFIDNTNKNEVSTNMKFFDSRSIFYYENFGLKNSFNPGANGCDSVIIAYDCFMDSKSFESLIYYSMLHAGDSDTTGCIAGSFYGAYYDNSYNELYQKYDIDMKSEINKLILSGKLKIN